MWADQMSPVLCIPAKNKRNTFLSFRNKLLSQSLCKFSQFQWIWGDWKINSVIWRYTAVEKYLEFVLIYLTMLQQNSYLFGIDGV